MSGPDLVCANVELGTIALTCLGGPETASDAVFGWPFALPYAKQMFAAQRVVFLSMDAHEGIAEPAVESFGRGSGTPGWVSTQHGAQVFAYAGDLGRALAQQPGTSHEQLDRRHAVLRVRIKRAGEQFRWGAEVHDAASQVLAATIAHDGPRGVRMIPEQLERAKSTAQQRQ